MTEEEAKTKWCPHARETMDHGHGAANRDYSGKPISKCLGSTCMAWRTRHQWLDNAQQRPDWVSYEPYAFEPGPGQERDYGYCGLAGAPQ